MSALPIADVLGSESDLVTNIVDTWEGAHDTELEDGRLWYARAHGIAASLDPTAPTRAAAVIAALSPQVSWDLNVRLARRFYATGVASGTFGANCHKARRLLNLGESPTAVLGDDRSPHGHKVRAFFACIDDPADDFAVCVDRHAVAIAVGRTLSQSERKVLDRRGAYNYVASAYRCAALTLGERPSELQAITWLAWRSH